MFMNSALPLQSVCLELNFRSSSLKAYFAGSEEAQLIFGRFL